MAGARLGKVLRALSRLGLLSKGRYVAKRQKACQSVTRESQRLVLLQLKKRCQSCDVAWQQEGEEALKKCRPTKDLHSLWSLREISVAKCRKSLAQRVQQSSVNFLTLQQQRVSIKQKAASKVLQVSFQPLAAQSQKSAKDKILKALKLGQKQNMQKVIKDMMVLEKIQRISNALLDVALRFGCQLAGRSFCTVVSLHKFQKQKFRLSVQSEFFLQHFELKFSLQPHEYQLFSTVWTEVKGKMEQHLRGVKDERMGVFQEVAQHSSQPRLERRFGLNYMLNFADPLLDASYNLDTDCFGFFAHLL